MASQLRREAAGFINITLLKQIDRKFIDELLRYNRKECSLYMWWDVAVAVFELLNC